jgi:predicted amidohydrolase YtcJ
MTARARRAPSVNDHQVFKAAASAAVWGKEALARTPPLDDLLAAGIPLAAGTDANRASSFSPWLSLWWLITGTSLDGVRRRDEHLISRAQALRLYSAGSAWLSFEEADRGHLHPGARADLAVLNADYFGVAEELIPAIRSELTVVGGRCVHSTAKWGLDRRFARNAARRRRLVTAPGMGARG